MRIVITGGHPAPALAIIEGLLKKRIDDIHFIGRQFAVDDEIVESYEFKQVTKLGLPFYHLHTGRLTRVASLNTLRNVARVFNGMYDSYRLLRKIQPDVIMSFGGFIALPVCIVGRLLGVKVITHEQTIAPGLANIIISRFANRILISFPETLKYFDVKKTRVTGNPLRPQILQEIQKPIDIKLTKKSKPLLYITGGSLGSHSVNIHVENILDQLCKKFIVLHQVGNIEAFGDYERLSTRRKKDYYVVPHIHTDEIGWVFHNAHIVVSRGGANTTFELIAHKKPSVIIPLPWSGNNEQERQAKLFSTSGAGEMFDQNGESKDLYLKIMKIYDNYDQYKKNFRLLNKYVHKNAIRDIIEEIVAE